MVQSITPGSRGPFRWLANLPRASKVAAVAFVFLLVALPFLWVSEDRRKSRERAAAQVAELDRELSRSLESRSYQPLVSALRIALELAGKHAAEDELPPAISSALVQVLVQIPHVELVARVPERVLSLALSPDEHTLVAISMTSHDRYLARIIAAADGSVLATQELEGEVYNIAFSPNSQHVALGFEREIRLFDLTPGTPARSVDCKPRAYEGCQFGMLHGKELVTVRGTEEGSTVVRVDWESNQVLSYLHSSGDVQSLAVDRSGQTVAACVGGSFFVMVSDLESPVIHECGECGTAAPLQSTVFVPGKELVATTCAQAVCSFATTPVADAGACVAIDSQTRYRRSLHALRDGSLLLVSPPDESAVQIHPRDARSSSTTSEIPILFHYDELAQVTTAGLSLGHFGDSIVNVLTGETHDHVYPSVTAVAWKQTGEAYLGARHGDILTIGVKSAAQSITHTDTELAKTLQADFVQTNAGATTQCRGHWATLTSSGEIVVQALPLGSVAAVFPKPFGLRDPTGISCSAGGEYLLVWGPNDEIVAWPLDWALWVQRACEVVRAAPGSDGERVAGICRTPLRRWNQSAAD